MRITCNGEQIEVADDATIADLRARDALGQQGDQDGDPRTTTGGPDGSAVAVNGRVVPQAEHARHRLSPDDRVELVRAVPGG